MLTGCFLHFYKPIEQDKNIVAQNLKAPEFSNRYFVLRNGEDAYYMNNIAISDDKKTISCKIDELPSEHVLYLTKGHRGHMTYKKPANAKRQCLTRCISTYLLIQL